MYLIPLSILISNTMEDTNAEADVLKISQSFMCLFVITKTEKNNWKFVLVFVAYVDTRFISSLSILSTH